MSRNEVSKMELIAFRGEAFSSFYQVRSGGVSARKVDTLFTGINRPACWLPIHAGCERVHTKASGKSPTKQVETRRGFIANSVYIGDGGMEVLLSGRIFVLIIPSRPVHISCEIIRRDDDMAEGLMRAPH